MQNRKNNFDILLEMACKRCLSEDVNSFLNLDTTGFEMTERELKKIHEIIKLHFINPC